MSHTTEDWEQRLAKHWASLSEVDPVAFRSEVSVLIAELPPGDPRGLFERACAHDSTGQPDQAVSLYRAALAGGLSGLNRRRASIQLASSLRNLGQPEAAAKLLEAEAARGDDELSTAVQAFQALSLSDLGQDRAALSVALAALSKHLPRYNASLQRYAAELLEMHR